MLGIDIVLPDFSYVAERVDKLDAIVLTHGHEDHIGALPYLLREIGTAAEVWGTRLTLGLVKSKLDEHGLSPHVDLVEIKPEGGTRAGGPVHDGVHAGHPLGARRGGGGVPHRVRRRSCTPATSSSTRPRSTTGRPSWGGWARSVTPASRC